MIQVKIIVDRDNCRQYKILRLVTMEKKTLKNILQI